MGRGVASALLQHALSADGGTRDIALMKQDPRHPELGIRSIGLKNQHALEGCAGLNPITALHAGMSIEQKQRDLIG